MRNGKTWLCLLSQGEVENGDMLALAAAPPALRFSAGRGGESQTIAVLVSRELRRRGRALLCPRDGSDRWRWRARPRRREAPALLSARAARAPSPELDVFRRCRSRRPFA